MNWKPGRSRIADGPLRRAGCAR